MMAALASAAMPNTSMSGVYEQDEGNVTDNGAGIEYAVVQDSGGLRYDVFAASSDDGKKLLSKRVKSSKALSKSHEMGGLGFAVDRTLAFSAAGAHSATGKMSVLVTPHVEGEPRPLDLLTLQDAASVGTAIGAIHRQRTGFLSEANYPSFTTGQIHSQLTGWIKRLQKAGHVPPAITTSWARIIETDGLWSFSTTLTHGGFHDGDFRFSDSTITAVNNWQDMQVNDPARDLAWIFAKLDEDHRNTLMSAYGAIMGSRMDDLILLRANLWLQMEQVGDFIDALGRADNTKILQFKAQVEHLAHQLTVVANKAAGAATASSPVVPAKNADDTDAAAEPEDDTTGETDKTASAEVTKLVSKHETATGRSTNSDSSTERPEDSADDEDRTNGKQPKSAQASEASYRDMPAPSSSATMVLTQAGKSSIFVHEDDDATADGTTSGTQSSETDDTNDKSVPTTLTNHDAPTTVIPELERTERALRDAQKGIKQVQSEEHKLHDLTSSESGANSASEKATTISKPVDSSTNKSKDSEQHSKPEGSPR
ncbi:aminoglycoside phosphotransferase (APT) family kinase protein [Bifidobacterium commune]|uniref:Predicted kinase, aminoglycoside phosphotransferase (APT) family n=1 Tax=Bifidobacterium commune TaxID=1505727 RepID=A0A1C4GZL9_9BIFI|nr:phosphotransferase [Bifidobacterium commune]MBB2955235.1 aminoglycoside phosphotransferase (APT) family kinase protein [Bifidobacterium commune]SCC78114.1 Predicted kinase, aminoglycoside phosphotransferase (APT) family [Bifidobacterium commune]